MKMFTQDGAETALDTSLMTEKSLARKIVVLEECLMVSNKKNDSKARFSNLMCAD